MTAEQFIEPVSHEGDAHLIFTEHGLNGYYALNAAVRKNHDWDDGKPVANMTFNGEEFRLAAGYDGQPLLPWEHESYQMDTTPLFRISIASNDRLSDDEQADQSSRTVGGTITIRPRWPGMQKEDGEPVQGIPNLSQNGYIDCQIQVSNIPHEKYDELLSNALSAFGINSRYVEEPHDASNISDMARYVRVNRDMASPLHAADGPIARSHAVLQAGQGGYRKHVEDHTKLPGYYVTTTINDARASDIIKGHDLGKEIKHYYPQDPSYYDPSDALYHPKFEVAYQTSQTDKTLRWNDVEDAVRELDETIFNYLEWAGLSLRSGDTFEKDAVFAASESRRSVKLTGCPLPEIQDSQEAAVMDLWGQTTDSDRDLIDRLVSDGGKPTRQELADKSEHSYRTVRRFVDRCQEVVRDAHDGLSIDSKHKEQMLTERVRMAEQSFRDSVEDAVMKSADAVAGRARSKWSETKQKYGIVVEDSKYRKKIKVGWNPADREEMKTAIREIKIAGREWFESLRRLSLDITTQDGEHRQITNLDSWSNRGTPLSETTASPTTAPSSSRTTNAGRSLDERAREQFGKSLAELSAEQRSDILSP